MNLFNKILNILFPPKCVFCRKRLPDEGVCDDCAGKLPYRQSPLIKDKISFVDECYSPLYYEGNVRHAILRYKFAGLAGYSREFAKILHSCVNTHLSGKFDIVTWVPVSKRRLKKRGYDQSGLIAHELGRLLDMTPQKLLVKARDVPPQSKQPTQQKRITNIFGAFKPVDADLSGKSVLIVDDIATTGSTLSECARVLKTAGADKVYAVILAKTQLSGKLKK